MAISPFLAELAAPGIRSVRRNWPPIVLLQITALILLWSYFTQEGFRQWLEYVGRLKADGGLVAAGLVGAIGAGLTPEIAKALVGKLKRLDRAWLEKTLYTAFVYSLIGILVDVFYKVQAAAFGSGNAPATLAIKTAVDMLVFSPFLSIPMACTLFALFEQRFQADKMGKELRFQFYRRKIAPSLLLCWFFWTPVLLCVYAFPTPIQFPIAMIAEAAWSVLFVFMNTEQTPVVYVPNPTD